MTVTLPAMDDPAALRRLLGECSMTATLIEHILYNYVTSLWNKDSNLIWPLGEMFLCQKET